MSAATHSEVAPENQHDGTVAPELDLKAGRRKVARSRGVLSGILLMLLGAWAALVPFIGPYFDFGIEPRSGDAWHWTSGRGLYELLPGGVTFLAGLILLVSASRVLTVLMAWLAALAGAWLVVGGTLDLIFKVGIGDTPSNTGVNKGVAYGLLYFLATGVAIALIAGIALGRLSVHSVRDVRAAERQAEADATEAAEARRIETQRAEAQRAELQRAEADRNRDHDRDHDRDEPTAVQPRADDAYAAPPAGPYEQTSNRTAEHRTADQPTTEERTAQSPSGSGSHAAEPAVPPAPGGVGDYRYPTTTETPNETPTGTTTGTTTEAPAAPREERDR